MSATETMLAEEMKAEEAQEYKGHAISDLRKVFEAVQNKTDWKAEWVAAVPAQIVGLVCIAVEFFHADMAKIIGTEVMASRKVATGKVIMHGAGYQA